MDDVLNILERAGLSPKFKKSYLFRLSVDYLGHRIPPGKLKVALKRTQALVGFTQTQARSFFTGGLSDVVPRSLAR